MMMWMFGWIVTKSTTNAEIINAKFITNCDLNKLCEWEEECQDNRREEVHHQLGMSIG